MFYAKNLKSTIQQKLNYFFIISKDNKFSKYTEFKVHSKYSADSSKIMVFILGFNQYGFCIHK